MILPVVFRRIAKAELIEAAEWYEQRRTGLGNSFLAAVQQVLDRAALQPDFYPQTYRDIRQALVSGYPYCIYYRERSNRLLVIAVFHTARDPSVWKARA